MRWNRRRTAKPMEGVDSSGDARGGTRICRARRPDEQASKHRGAEVKSLQDQLATATKQRDDLQGKETAHATQLKNAEAAVLEAAALKKKSDEAEQAAQAALQAAKALEPTPAGKSKKSKK